jgi:type II restriction/modification system DNA methylase subunit YeeA
MTPQQFIDKWRSSTLTERAGSHSHFKDLCRLLSEPEPYEEDASDAAYAFEKGAAKTGGGDGWADVWKRGCFGWEYKGKHKDLGAALKQLKLYQGALENPPLLIVSDMEAIEIHTAFTSMVQERHVFTLDDLKDASKRALLKKAFSETGVEAFKPGRKRADVTADVAREFIALAQNLRGRKHPPEAVAHFVNRMVFCMFAEDVDLLPNKLFTKLLERSLDDPDRFQQRATQLFEQMKGGGELADFTKIEWFNGGLFDDGAALPLERADIKIALNAAKQDWANIDPSIMGTLFERGLDPDKRSQLGAHYTDPEKIMMIVRPVIIEPLTREWEAVKAQIVALIDAAPKETKEKLLRGAELAARTKALNKAEELHRAFVDKLKAFRILDPACGSGNFLFLGLKALKDIEHRVNIECEAFGLPRGFPGVGPENMLGIEINPFAAELARVSVWIGEIQWMREHGFDASRDPILKPLKTIACHDALLDDKGGEYKWPKCDAIIGNPPFLGGKRLRDSLGDETVERMFRIFEGRVAAEADLVCYWFAKAREHLEKRKASRVGLVTTNSIRGGANREVLDAIEEAGRIFEAWSDEEWIKASRTDSGSHAAVRVSIVCFDGTEGLEDLKLDGVPVKQINSDLTAGATNLTQAARLKENAGVAFMGDTKGGAFDIDGDLARQWLKAPRNPNGKNNSFVLRPWVNGMDLTRRPSGKWIVDFRWDMDETEAAQFELPFQYLVENVKPGSVVKQTRGYAQHWWRHERPRPDMWTAIARKSRYVVTPRVAKHRIFVWLERVICPDSATIATAREDDTSFGILHSRMHEKWSLGLGTWLGVGNDPRYTPSTTFETFPFPEGLTPNIPAAGYANDPRAIAIAKAAAKLNELRENWLNPEDLVRREPEVVPGYPDRILPVNEEAAKELKKRTLTNLYNQRPAWLDNAHRDLDAAVAAAYGWKDWGKDGLPDEEILARLFKLNQERAKAGR